MITSALPWNSSLRHTSLKKPTHVIDEIGILPPVVATLLAATDPRVKDATWGAFVERYTPLLLHAVHRLASSYDDAMDRYTYLLDHLSRDDYRRLRAFVALGPGRFTTWLVVVARRLLIDYQRRRYGRLRLETAEDPQKVRNAALVRWRLAEMVGDEMQLCLMGDAATDLEAGAFAADCTTALQTVLKCLEPHDQLLLNLRFDKELSAREIAHIIGCPSQFHVYRRLKAVLAALRQLLPQAYSEYVGLIPWSDLPGKAGKAAGECPCTDAGEASETGRHERAPGPQQPSPSQPRGDGAVHRSHAGRGSPEAGGTPPGRVRSLPAGRDRESAGAARPGVSRQKGLSQSV